MGTGLCIDGYSSDEINYHIMILDEAGLILANNASHGNNCIWFPIRLTWNGHDFLEVAREDKNWMKAKEITSKIGGWTFDLFKQILVSVISESLKGILLH
jgi:hypothetical protein